MTSLGFDLLDLHVVRGRGDDVAWSDDTGTLTFAQLLEQRAQGWPVIDIHGPMNAFNMRVSNFFMM